MSRFGSAILAALVAATGGASTAAAAVGLTPIGAYDRPMYVTSDPGDPGRLFVAERDGIVQLTRGGTTSPFLQIPQPVYTSGEQGLFSIAFSPDFASSGLFYVAYSGGASSANDSLVIDEYRAAGDNADPASRREVISIPHTPATNHNGGQLQFGPDGYLYISTGDGADGSNAQAPGNLLGKILRIDPRPSGTAGYSVPADNPFVGEAGVLPEIWAFGLRNPWRFSFDRLTGALVIGDVGEGSREEVDYAAQAAGGGAGANFGWPCFEGKLALGSPATCEVVGTLTPPLYDYAHSENVAGVPDSCSITGGYVVRDPGLPELAGRYLFTDLCGGDLRSIDPGAPPPTGGHRGEGPTPGSPVSFGEDACGRLYLAGFGADAAGNNVFRLTGSGESACAPDPGPGPGPGPGPAADTAAPETTLSMREPKRRARRVFDFGSSELGSRFECRVDQRDWRTCESPRKLKRLAPGRHRFRVRAIDAAGNRDSSPAKRRFEIRPPRRG